MSRHVVASEVSTSGRARDPDPVGVDAVVFGVRPDLRHRAEGVFEHFRVLVSLLHEAIFDDEASNTGIAETFGITVPFVLGKHIVSTTGIDQHADLLWVFDG